MAAVDKSGDGGPKKRSLLHFYAEFAGAAISRLRSENRLNAARIDAELANRAKSDFVANMSHDLRTPLNAIIGFSEVLAFTDISKDNSVKTKEYARDISGAGHHLLGIINDMLDLARLESGQPVVELESCELPEVVRTATVFVAAMADAKGQTLTAHSDDGLPLVLLDPLRTKQVIINLLSNAIKFTPPGGEISVETRLSADGGVVLRVSDNGPGMNRAELEHAQSRFGRVRNSSRRAQEGTGLGLTIVKKLCEAQGGRFELSSSPGKGTCASVTFPGTCNTPDRI